MACMLEIRKSMWIDDGMSGLNKIATSQLGTSQCSSQLRFKSTPFGFTRRHQSPWQTGEQTLWTKYSKNNLKTHRDCQGMFQIWIGLQFILFLAGSGYLRDTTDIKWECNSLQTKWNNINKLFFGATCTLSCSTQCRVPCLFYLGSATWIRVKDHHELVVSPGRFRMVLDGSGAFQHPTIHKLHDLMKTYEDLMPSTELQRVYIFIQTRSFEFWRSWNKNYSIVKRLSVVELEWTWHILNHLGSKQNIFLLANGFDLKTNVWAADFEIDVAYQKINFNPSQNLVCWDRINMVKLI